MSRQKTPWARVTREAFQLGMMKYVFAAQFVSGKTVLDVSSGAGYGSHYMAGKGVREVIGGDIDASVVAWSKRHYSRERLEFVVLDATVLPFPDDSFDVVVTLETIEHLREYEGFLAECRRVLKNGGTIVCSTPNKAVSDYTEEHVSLFHTEELRSLLRRYFEVTGIYGQYWIDRKEKVNNGLLVTAMRILAFIPGKTAIKDFATRFIWRRYRTIELPVGEAIDRVQIDARYQEIQPVQDASSSIPGSLIAVCRAAK